LDYNKRLIGTTEASSWVSDITNPKININPAPGTRFNRLSRQNMLINDLKIMTHKLQYISDHWMNK